MRLISSVILTLLFSVVCFAQEVETLYDFEVYGIYYKLVSDSEVMISPISKTENNGVTTYLGINTVYELTISEIVYYNDTHYTLVGIADHAFENSTELGLVKFDGMSSINNPISIGESAFENCDNLTSVVITRGIKEIGARAFYGCDKLKNVALGASTDFYDNTLTINQNAFALDSSLQYVFLTHYNPNSYILDSCFGENTSDITFYIPNNNFEYEPSFSSFNKKLYGSFDYCSVEYTGEAPQFTPIFKSNLPSGFNANSSYFNSYEKNVGSYSSSCWITITSGYPDYILIGVSLPLNYAITPAPLTISTGNYERAYGEANPEITINVEGYLNGDNESVFSYKPIIVNGLADWWPALPDETSEVGEYIIYTMAELPFSSNYEVNYVNGFINVVAANQTLEWSIENDEYYVGDKIDLNGVSSSGLSLEYESSNPDVAIIEDGKLLFIGEGNVTISASQSGSKNFNAAEPISHTFIVYARESEGLTLNTSSAELKIQDQLQLVISDYEWSSSDESVAKVSESGLVSAVDSGSAMITLSRKKDGATLAVCQVSVDRRSSVSEKSIKKELQIKCVGTEVRIEGASPSSIVNISDISGKMLYSGTERTIPLYQGIFIISIENSQSKVILK